MTISYRRAERVDNQKPINAANHAQEIRDFVTVQQAKNYEKNKKKYESAENFAVGDIVHRRIKKPFGKESNLSNVSKNLFKIVKVLDTWPLPSFKLQDVVAGITLPGSYQANVLIKK